MNPPAPTSNPGAIPPGALSAIIDDCLVRQQTEADRKVAEATNRRLRDELELDVPALNRLGTTELERYLADRQFSEAQYETLAEYYYRTGLLYEGRDRGDWLMTARQLLDLADNHNGHASTNRMERKRLLDQLIQSV